MASNSRQPHAHGHQVANANGESSRIPPEFQKRVGQLLQEKNTGFRGHINSAADVPMYERAIAQLKGNTNKKKSEGDKSTGYPTDEQGRLIIRQRIYAAFFNTDGEQDLVSDSLPNRPNCPPYQAVQDTSPVEVEIIAYNTMDAMLRVQQGKEVERTDIKVIIQERDYMAKVDKVVEALNFNKSLCRSAKDKPADFIDRIAANPAFERELKVKNQVINNGKKVVLKKDSAARGKSRAAHGTAKARGKGKGKKRQAADDDDDDDDDQEQQQQHHQGAAEVQEGSEYQTAA